MAAPEELREERREPRDVLEPVGQRLPAVEVAADPHVIRACDAAEVVDVVRDLGQGGHRHRMLAEPAAPDLTELVVGGARVVRRVGVLDGIGPDVLGGHGRRDELR